MVLEARSLTRAATLLGGVARPRSAGAGSRPGGCGYGRSTSRCPVCRRSSRAFASHLSDFHFGLPHAVRWPPSVRSTGSSSAARSRRDRAISSRVHVGAIAPAARAPRAAFVVLGNHDVEHNRDPFSRCGTRICRPRVCWSMSATVDTRPPRAGGGCRPRAYREDARVRGARVSRRSAGLLCHFTYVLSFLPRGR